MALSKAATQSFNALFEKMLTNWPVDSNRTHGLREALLEVCREVGEPRFRSAVDSLLADRPYNTFPTLGEFRQYIPSAQQRRHSCAQCQNGFIDAGQDEAGNRQVARCPNRHEAGKSEAKISWAMAEDRKEHPENYFGVPDVVCAMRAQFKRKADGLPLYSADEIFSIIALARKKYGPKFETTFNVEDF